MLTQAKVERLLTDLSARARAETAAIVAEEFVGGALSDSESRIAVDILMVLANDVEQHVREALAGHVKDCPHLPRAIALQLARDLDPVAAPILQWSPALCDADLIAIVRGGSTAKQIAIARRVRVAEIVADALVDTHRRQVVGAVLENHGAVLSEATLTVLVDQYRGDSGMQLLLAERPMLPQTVLDRLLECASAEVAARLVLRDTGGRGGAEQEAAFQRDRAFSRLLAQLAPAELERLALALHAKGHLAPALLLRCLCDGHVVFFEAAMAALAGLTMVQARPLIHDRGPLGLQAVYIRAGLPDMLLPAFRAGVAAMQEWSRRGGGDGRSGLIELVRVHFAEAYPGLDAGDLDDMLAQLAHLHAARWIPAG